MLNKVAVVKSSLIDLELLPGKAEDNKGQAGNTVQPDRLNKKTSEEEAIVEPLWKHREVAEMTTRLSVG